jgi:hypothetical protein
VNYNRCSEANHGGQRDALERETDHIRFADTLDEAGAMIEKVRLARDED